MYVYIYTHTCIEQYHATSKLQVIFHKRTTKYRDLLQKVTYKDKASYGSSPPCTPHIVKYIYLHTYTHIHIHLYRAVPRIAMSIYVCTHIIYYMYIYLHIYTHTFILYVKTAALCDVAIPNRCIHTHIT